MIPDLKGHVFTLASQKPERPGNHDLVVGAISEYLSKNGASEVSRGLTAGQMPVLKKPSFPKKLRREVQITKAKKEDDDASDEDEDVDLIYERDKSIFNIQSKLWADKTYKIEQQKFQACTVIMAQSSDALTDRLKADPSFEEIIEVGDCIRLLALVKTSSLGHGGRGYELKNSIDGVVDLLTCSMGPRESRRNYYSRFDAAILHATNVGLKLETLIDLKDLTKLSDHDKVERVKAYLLISGADDSRFDAYKEWLHKKAIHGEDSYPKTLCLAMTGLDEHKQKRSAPVLDLHNGTSFQQGGKEFVAGTDGVLNKKKQCWNCNKWGHRRPNCPDKKKRRKKKSKDQNESEESESDDGDNIAQFGEGDEEQDTDDPDEEVSEAIQHAMMALGARCFASVKIDRDGRLCLLILLDTGSTHHVFCNPSLLKDIRHSDKPLTINTNAGDFNCPGKGVFPGIGRVWYNPEGIQRSLCRTSRYV